jgi:hypothetical protein
VSPESFLAVKEAVALIEAHGMKAEQVAAN